MYSSLKKNRHEVKWVLGIKKYKSMGYGKIRDNEENQCQVKNDKLQMFPK